MNAYLSGLECWLPESRRTNDDLVRLNPAWNADDIFRKTGIRSRPIAAQGETASDLAANAAEKLFQRTSFDRRKVDALIFCTQSPDYQFPTSACLLQLRLGLPTSCGAFDVNLGCSGFTYGLWLARALIASSSAKHVLLLAGETLSKYCNPHDMITATVFGDGAGAALISGDARGALAVIGPTVAGSDGRGADNLIIRAGGARLPKSDQTCAMRSDEHGNIRSDEQIYMNGPEVFGFTLSAVPAAIQQLLDKLGVGWSEIDRFLLHQANGFILESLRRKMRLTPDRLPIDMEDTGNTACASLPILLRRSLEGGLLKRGDRCVLAGYGVGYSWAMTYIRWGGEAAHSDSPTSRTQRAAHDQSTPEE